MWGGGGVNPLFCPSLYAVNTLLEKLKARPHLGHSLHYCERQHFNKGGKPLITLISRRQI